MYTITKRDEIIIPFVYDVINKWNLCCVMDLGCGSGRFWIKYYMIYKTLPKLYLIDRVDYSSSNLHKRDYDFLRQFDDVTFIFDDYNKNLNRLTKFNVDVVISLYAGNDMDVVRCIEKMSTKFCLFTLFNDYVTKLSNEYRELLISDEMTTKIKFIFKNNLDKKEDFDYI